MKILPLGPMQLGESTLCSQVSGVLINTIQTHGQVRPGPLHHLWAATLDKGSGSSLAPGGLISLEWG